MTMRWWASVGGLNEESSTRMYFGGCFGGVAITVTASSVGMKSVVEDDGEEEGDGREQSTRKVEPEASKR